ncbi:SDR family oxidoreductase [Allofournierella sp.]
MAGRGRRGITGRQAQPDELAGAYGCLAMDDASFTTGTILHMDGGIVM